MNLMDLLEQEGGAASVAKLAGQLGIDKADAGKLIGALSPSLLGGLQKQVQSPESRAGLEQAIESGNHEKYLDDPASVSDDATREDGNNILGHLFGSKDVSRNVAAQASESTGIEASLIKKALPIVASLAMGVMSRKAGAGSGSGGGLGALAGLLGGSDGKFDMGDLRNVAGRFL